ncbi:MAG: acyltransferase [Chitinophagaceae bacterium]
MWLKSCTPTHSVLRFAITRWISRAGLACLLIVMNHSTAYSHLPVDSDNWSAFHNAIFVIEKFWIAVPVFFVISGYCIAAAADNHRRSNRSNLEYFTRRFRRIYPPFWIWVIASSTMLVVASPFLQPTFFGADRTGLPKPTTLSAWQWLGNLTLTEGWRGLYFDDGIRFLQEHFWTLGYEEQFYFIAGVVLIVSRKYLFHGFLAVTAATAWFRLTQIQADGLFLDGRWFMFAAGILVFYWLHLANSRARKFWLVVLFLALIWRLSSILELMTAPTNHIAPSCGVAFLFAFLLLAIYPLDLRIDQATVLRPIKFCGHMCYSVYLVHLPIVRTIGKLMSQAGMNGGAETLLITVPVCVIVSVFTGWLFHLSVERNFLNKPTVRDAENSRADTVFGRIFRARPIAADQKALASSAIHHKHSEANRTRQLP